ncbi:pyridoxamine 5'-phosphate oxidase family protein [Candidatus Bathyarchaeota archaeon]|nr:pyridoxamine 5'-phosphate oxidase family protein [Candidatus Bathyarchaeota archaeon]
MKKLEGLEEAFSRAKVVFLSTYDGGKERSRQMTNFNESPYETMWFPTEKGTRKVEDIKKNPAMKITFPAGEKGEYYEITGEASFEDPRVVSQKWEWWWLYWHPAQKDRFWFPRGETVERRVIINVKPLEAKLVKR